MRSVLAALAAALAASVVHADIYMHNPRGSNDRNCERNANRDNGNRLFDSQNNNAGGYACPRAVGGPEVETEKFYYYVGSKVPIEWTSQHGCGTNPNVKCEIVIQYTCEEILDPLRQYRGGPRPPAPAINRPDPFYVGAPRDGTPRDANDAATDTIPDDPAVGVANTVENRRFGMHETPDYYTKCKQRSRNRGLFVADQVLRRNDARATRQNPNGNRNGLECPEERDHYPYWHPNPWVDIAVIHDHTLNMTDPAFNEWCNYYRNNSQNNPMTSAAGECVEVPNPTAPTGTPTAATLKAQGNWYNTPLACQAAGHQWTNFRFGLNPATAQLLWNNLANIAPMDCLVGGRSRSNHLGNAESALYQSVPSTVADDEDFKSIPSTNDATRFVWTVPNTPSKSCVLRIRYNISTTDYPAWAVNAGNAGGPLAGTPGLNSSFNGVARSPLLQDPYVNISSTMMLSLAVNTNQYGRTFQDRSYVFEIRTPMTLAQSASNTVDSLAQRQQDDAVATALATTPQPFLFNLNVRGKRGNIVQTFPSVEYDFIPNNLFVRQNDLVHWQWTGSDYNPRRGCNNAEGGPPDPNAAAAANQNARADRSNVIQLESLDANFPMQFFPSPPPVAMFMTADRSAVDMTTVLKLAYLDQLTQLAGRGERCLTLEELNAIQDVTTRETHPNNCAKLNAARTPYFDGGVTPMREPGNYGYFSSRNNNFSNRDQKGRLCIAPTGVDRLQYCTGQAVVVPPPGSGSSAGAAMQISADAVDVNVTLLVADTAAMIERDNDKEGDGEQFGCGEMSGLNLDSPESQAGFAIGMIAVGVIIVLSLQIGIGYLVARRHGRANNGFLEYTTLTVGDAICCRPPGTSFGTELQKPKPVPTNPPAPAPATTAAAASRPTTPGDRPAHVIDEEDSPLNPPPPPRKPIVSWVPSRGTTSNPDTSPAPASAAINSPLTSSPPMPHTASPAGAPAPIELPASAVPAATRTTTTASSTSTSNPTAGVPPASGARPPAGRGGRVSAVASAFEGRGIGGPNAPPAPPRR